MKADFGLFDGPLNLHLSKDNMVTAFCNEE